MLFQSNSSQYRCLNRNKRLYGPEMSYDCTDIDNQEKFPSSPSLFRLFSRHCKNAHVFYSFICAFNGKSDTSDDYRMPSGKPLHNYEMKSPVKLQYKFVNLQLSASYWILFRWCGEMDWQLSHRTPRTQRESTMLSSARMKARVDRQSISGPKLSERDNE